MERVHIVGAGPRTGTTLIYEMMAASFDVKADGHEVSATRLFKADKPVLTKSPAQMRPAAARMLLDPHFHVVFMMRDPRDAVTSKHRKSPKIYWTNYWFWRDAVARAERRLGEPRFLMIRYEDLATAPDNVQARLKSKLRFLRSKTGGDDQFSTYAERARTGAAARQAMNGVRAVTTSGVGRWKSHLPRVAGQLARYPEMSQALIDHGYERDAAWVSQLAGVEPDLSGSFWPDEPDRKFFASDLLKEAAGYAVGGAVRAGRLAGLRIS